MPAGIIKYVVLAIASLMYVAVIVFPDKKSTSVLIAAFLIMISGAVCPSEALTQLINWNIMMIFMGSLLIAELFIYSRVPARLADEIIDRSPNVGLAIISILIMTGIISAFVENVATVLVMAPIALALSKKLDMDPSYFLVGLAVMANLQGTATLVGDPPSMIFAAEANYNFNDFFWHAGRPSIFFVVQIGMLAGALYFWFHFRKTANTRPNLDKEAIVSWLPTLLLVAMIAGLALVSFFSTGGGVSLAAGLLVLGLALVGLLWYSFVRKEGFKKGLSLVKNLDWDTSIFLMGIFIVIGAISRVGLLDDLSLLMQGLIGENILLGFVVIIAFSTLLSGFIDNVPYIIVMLPVAGQLIAGLNASTGSGIHSELYMFALLIGSCLGGNLTPFGASANVVTIGILNKQGYKMNFGKWLKLGLPFTLITTLAASLFLWLVWR